MLEWTLEPLPAAVRVRWAATLTDTARADLERRYSLTGPGRIEGRTWGYILTDPSSRNLQALVNEPAAEDTDEIDRVTFKVTPEATVGQRAVSRHSTLSAMARAVSVGALMTGLFWLGCGLAAGSPPPTRGEGRRAAPLTSRQRWLAASLLGTLLTLSVSSEWRTTTTNDEPNHLQYGRNVLALRTDRFDDSKMPVTALNALPGAAGSALPDGVVARLLQTQHAARYPTVLFAVATAWLVFVWSRALYGATAALLSLALFVFDPNLLAHGQLITTDMYAAGIVSMVVYAFWRLLRAPGSRTACVCGTALGAAQIMKYSLVLLVPVLALVALVYFSREIAAAARTGRRSTLTFGVYRTAGYALQIVAAALLVINAGYVFNDTYRPLGQFRFQSGGFNALQERAGVLAQMPLPLPAPYLEGLDLVLEHERTGSSYGQLYLFGQLRSGTGFPGYYLFATLYKTPLATLALIVAATVSLMWRTPGVRLRDEMLLVLPIIGFGIYFNVFNRAQIGIRYFLVVFPLLYVLCGRLLAQATSVARWKTLAIPAAVTAAAASVLSYYPAFLPYFNELVPDRRLAYRILADSNLDWGQNGWYVDRYRRSHPDVVIEPERPTAGTILVRVNKLTGVTEDPRRYQWLREHFVPDEHLGYATLVYRIYPADLKRLE